MVERAPIKTQHTLCLTGCEKFHADRDIIKWLRKTLAPELASPDDLPVHSVAKKRGNVFCFLRFADFEQKDKF